MQFSLRRLIGFITLGCVALGAATFAVAAGGKVWEAFVLAIAAVVLAVALYAACDPWAGYPAKLDKDPAQVFLPRFHSGPVTLALSLLVGVLCLLAGLLWSLIAISGGIGMKSPGVSVFDWLKGSGVIAATCIGNYARGAGLVGFTALLLGSPLGRRWAATFGLCAGSLIATLVWRLAGHRFGVTASILCVLLLVGGLLSAVYWVGRGSTLGRRSRRWGARAFLLGLIVGATAAAIPAVDRLLPGTGVFFLTALIGSSLGAIVGILAGSETPSTQGTSPFQLNRR
jgi:hypothetical protein